MSCPTLEQLERYATGEMTGPKRDSVETHVATCEDCRGRLGDVESNVRMGDKLGSPPVDQMPHDTENPPAGSTPAAPTIDARRPPHTTSSVAQPRFTVEGYKILRELSRGGQGVVYQAVQKSTKRKVAIKVLKQGHFADAGERARFEREIQILGQLKHTNIVTIYDSGSVGGNAYYVMDYISGKSLDAYAADSELSIDEALKLFQTVCDAVHTAHLRGIIHRDLKPSNIRIDTDGQPHVLDFGLAKMAGSETGASLMTMTGQFLGSLPWSSPEQAEGVPSKIDIRTDVYSLGVILYQMLTGGKFPYEVLGNMRDVLDRIMKAEPSRPSTIRRQINDEVETIVLKCLSKERDRRYQSAGELARDIQHYQAGEPIEAKRDSGWYVLKKTLRRYRVPAATAVAFVLLLIGATAISTVFYFRAADAATRESQQRQIAELEATRADKEKAVAEAVNDFLTKDLLAAVAPSSEPGKGKDVLMRSVLDEAAERIEEASRVGGRFEEMPLVEASIRATLGWTYFLLGEYAAAEPHLERARLLRRRKLGEEHPGTLYSMNRLALLYKDQGRYSEAERLSVTTLEIQKRVLGEEHPDTLKSMSSLALLYTQQGRYSDAEPLFAKTLEIRNRVLGKEHSNTLDSMNNLAILYKNRWRYDEAEPLYIKSLVISKRVLGEEHPDTLKSMTNLANLYFSQERYDEAESLHVKTLEIRNRVLGEEHPDTLKSMNNLASLYEGQGQYDEAEPLHATTLKIQKRILGEEHPLTLDSMNNLALVYRRQGRYDEAERLSVTTLELQKRILGEENMDTLGSMANLADLYADQGRYDEAERLYLKTLEIMKRVLGEEHLSTLLTVNSLAILYYRQGRYDEAERLSVTTLEIQKPVVGAVHPDTLKSTSSLALLYTQQGRYDEEERLYLKTLEIRKRVLGEEHLYTLLTMNNLAWYLLTREQVDLRDPETALRLARDACAMTDNANPGLLDTLALAQHLTGDTPAAIETEKKALSLLPPDAPGRGEYEAALARFEAALQEPDTAEEPGGG